jgi:hypothetical protein
MMTRWQEVRSLENEHVIQLLYVSFNSPFDYIIGSAIPMEINFETGKVVGKLNQCIIITCGWLIILYCLISLAE